MAELTYRLAQQCERSDKASLMKTVKKLILELMVPEYLDSEIPENLKICY